MNTNGPKGAILPMTALAGAAITANRAVKRGATADAVIPATANSLNIGIAEDNQDTVGKAVKVAHRPGEIVTAVAGAAIAADARVTSDATGRMVTATTGQNVMAFAREAAGGAGELIAVELAAPGLLAP
jgi:hypothetical protein